MGGGEKKKNIYRQASHVWEFILKLHQEFFFFFFMQLKITEGNVKDLLDESAAFLYRRTKQPLEICFRRLAVM